jgi:hypothetical protein
MRLSELKGYKNEPLYIILQNSTNISEFIENLEANNYKEYMIGSGFFSGVFARPQDNYVIKIFQNDKGYNKFLKYILQNQNNPHIPKIKGKPITLLKKYKIVRIEKLSPITTPEQEEIFNKLYHYINRKYPNGKADNQSEIKYTIKNKYPNIIPILEIMIDNKTILDFHKENMMFRGDTPVITDPYADFRVNPYQE